MDSKPRGSATARQLGSFSDEPNVGCVAYDLDSTEINAVVKRWLQAASVQDEVATRDFLIPTPVGDYNPDWAISFKEGSVRHIYFVAETKGTMSSLKLREIERAKIACARKFFDDIRKSVAKIGEVRRYHRTTAS